MNKQRIRKISEEIKRIISSTIMLEMKDPRLPKVITITEVKVNPDLKNAKVFFSAIDNNEIDKLEIESILNGAKGLFKREIGSKMHIFNTPDLEFIYDDTIVEALKMDELLRKIGNDKK